MAATSSSSRWAIGAAAILFFIAVAEGTVLGLRWFRDAGRARGASSFLRGREIASGLGCFGCHGPEGERGIPNPRARDGEIPSWSGGNFMMYNESPGEIREWILDGISKRLHDDPRDQNRRSTQLIAMPAYKGRVSGRDLDDLVAFVQAVSAALKAPEGAAADGRSLAAENGCFGCHGPEGRGLISNPGSFKGSIPAWDGGDFAELVRTPDEFREWVRQGEIKRLRDNPAAAHFLDGQVIKMPAYRGILSEEDIEKVRSYVEWVRSRTDHPPAP